MISLCLAVTFLFGIASCDLSIVKTKECDQITCDYQYYCSKIDYTCKPCRRVCEPGGNYDLRICNTFCQDYIHDMRYMRRDEVVENAKEQIEKLKILTTISLIFSCIVFTCLVLVVGMLWLNKKTKLNVMNIKSQMIRKMEKPDVTRKDDRIHRNSGEISMIRTQNDSVLNIQDITDIMHSKTVPPQDDYRNMTTFKNHHAKSEPDSASSIYTNKTNKTTQPLAKRLPSEDSTLDFIYDNPALAPSPVLNKDAENSSSGSRKVSSSDT